LTAVTFTRHRAGESDRGPRRRSPCRRRPGPGK
jgi:hypothetical protein